MEIVAVDRLSSQPRDDRLGAQLVLHSVHSLSAIVVWTVGRCTTFDPVSFGKLNPSLGKIFRRWVA